MIFDFLEFRKFPHIYMQNFPFCNALCKENAIRIIFCTARFPPILLQTEDWYACSSPSSNCADLLGWAAVRLPGKLALPPASPSDKRKLATLGMGCQRQFNGNRYLNGDRFVCARPAQLISRQPGTSHWRAARLTELIVLYLPKFIAQALELVYAGTNHLCSIVRLGRWRRQAWINPVEGSPVR